MSFCFISIMSRYKVNRMTIHYSVSGVKLVDYENR